MAKMQPRPGRIIRWAILFIIGLAGTMAYAAYRYSRDSGADRPPPFVSPRTPDRKPSRAAHLVSIGGNPRAIP